MPLFHLLFPTSMSDELAEIGGLKPKVLLDEGEEKQVSSKTRCNHFAASSRALFTPMAFEAPPRTSVREHLTIITGKD